MQELSLVTDPAFYAFAVPAALLIGISKSGFASGIGSLAVPLVAMAVTVPQAVAITLPILAAADVAGIFALRRGADGPLLRTSLLPAGLVGIALGWASFGLLDSHVVAGIVGVAILLFLLQQWFWPPKVDGPLPSPLVTRMLAVVSGFTSFVANAGGPPMAAALLPRRMAPMAFAGTSAIFFATINATKWVPYALLGLLTVRNLETSVALMPIAAAGVWAGMAMARRISARWFYRLVQAGMLLSGLKLLAEGFRTG